MRLKLSVLLIFMTMSAGATNSAPAPLAGSRTTVSAVKALANPNAKSKSNSKKAKRKSKATAKTVARSRATFVATTPEKPVASPIIQGVAVQLDPAVTIAQAYTTEDEKLQAILSFVFFNDARKYGWPSNYTAMWCPTNAFHLLKRLQQAGVDLHDAEVWYLIPAESAIGTGEAVIHPREARPIGEARVGEWAFHVVLSVHGRVLDLDFKSQPEVLSQVQYAAQMWAKGPLARPREDSAPLYIRRIPATDYLAQYANNWDDYVAGAVSGGAVRYPAVEMSSLFPVAVGNAAQ